MTAGSSLTASYAHDFTGHLPLGRAPALVVVDVVRAYTDRGSPLYADAFVAAVPVIFGLLAAARAAGVPVIFTNVIYQQDGADGGLFYRKLPALRCFVAGNPLGGFPDALRPAPGDLVVTKQYASAFFGTSLAATLNSRRVDTVVLAGFSTSGCLRASALDALQHGFVPLIAADACADRHPGPHEANLFDLQAKYAEVRDSGAVTLYLQQQQRAANSPR